ncbi:MAG: hypothetical protein ACO3QP_06125 [Burkholderiaceae bacterium]
MATISDKINQGLTNLTTSPLGMASLGLLMQPSMSKEPINPWQYAAQGMQLGIQNRAQQQQLQEEQARQAENDEMRRTRYLMEIERFQNERIQQQQAAVQAKREDDALREFIAGLPPEEARMASILGREYAKGLMAQRMGSSRLPAALIQEYEVAKGQGFPGTLIDYQREKTSRPVSPNFQAIPTAQGVQVFDTRTGQIVGTQGQTPAQFDPNVARDVAAGKAGGALEGERTTTARLDLPSYLDSSAAMLNKVQQLVQHPGMSAAVGAPSPGKMMGMVPGSEAANFKARLDEIRGGQFLEAFKTLRGGGAITQVEGEKATQAISRMSTSQSEQEFVKAANEFMDVVRRGMERAQRSAGQSPAPPVSAPNSVNFEDLP